MTSPRCGNGPMLEILAGRLSFGVMSVRGPSGSAPGIVEGQPWTTMPGSTSPWNGGTWGKRPGELPDCRRIGCAKAAETLGLELSQEADADLRARGFAPRTNGAA